MTQATKGPGLATRTAARAVGKALEIKALADEMRAAPSTQGAGTKASNNDNTNVSTFTQNLFGVAIGQVQNPVVSAALSSDQFISVVTSDSLTVPGSESDPDSLRKAKTTLSLKLKYLGTKSSSVAAELSSMGESTSKLNSVEQDLLVKAALSNPSVWENWAHDSMNPKDAVVHLILSLSTQSEKPEEFIGDVLTHLTSVSSFEPSRASASSPLMAKSVAEELVDCANHAKEVAVAQFTPAVVGVVATNSSAVAAAHSDYEVAYNEVDNSLSSLSTNEAAKVSQSLRELDNAKISDSQASERLSSAASTLAQTARALGAGTNPSFQRANKVLSVVSVDYSDTAKVDDGSGNTRSVAVVSGFVEIHALLDALKTGTIEEAEKCLTGLENCALFNKKNKLRGRVFASLDLDQNEVEDAVAELKANLSAKKRAQTEISRLESSLSSDPGSERVLVAVSAELDARETLASAIAADPHVATAVSLFSSALNSASAGSAFRPSDSDYSVEEKTGKVSLKKTPKSVYADSNELETLERFVRTYNVYAVAKTRGTYPSTQKLVDETFTPFVATLSTSRSDESLKTLVQEIVSSEGSTGEKVRERVVEHANAHVYLLAKTADEISKDYSQKPAVEFAGSALSLRGKRHASLYSLPAAVASSTVSAKSLGGVAANWSAFKATPKPLKSPSRTAQALAPRIGSKFGSSFWADAYSWSKEHLQAAVYWGLSLITHPEIVVKRTKKTDEKTGESYISFEWNTPRKSFGSEKLLIAGDRYVLSRRSWAALKFVMMATFWNSLMPAPETDEGRFNHARTVVRETTPVTNYAWATWPMRVVLLPVSAANYVGSQIRRDVTVFDAAATGTGANDYRLTSGQTTTVYPWNDDLVMPFDSRREVRTFLHLDYGTETPVMPIVRVTTSVANASYALTLPDSEAAAIFGLPAQGSRARLAYLKANEGVATAILELQSGERVTVSSAPMPTMLDRPADRPTSREGQTTARAETLPQGGHCVERATDVLCNLVTVTRTPIDGAYRLPRSATAALVDALNTAHIQRAAQIDPSALYSSGYLVESYELATAQRYNLPPSSDLHQLISFLMVHQSRINEAVGGALGSEGTSSMTIPLSQRAAFARALYASAVAAAPHGTNVSETPLDTQTLNLLVARLIPVPSVIESKLVEVLSNSADDESQRGARVDALYPAASNNAARLAFVAQVGNLENDADVALAATNGFNRANIQPNNSAELARFDAGMQRIRTAVTAVAAAHYGATRMAVDTSEASARSRMRNTYHVTSESELNTLTANPDIVAFLDRFRDVNSAFVLSTDPTTMNAFVREISTRARSSSVGETLGRMNPFETRGASLVEFCKARGFYTQRAASETQGNTDSAPQAATPVNSSGIPIAMSFPMEQIGANKQFPTVRMYIRRTLTADAMARFDSSVRGYVDRAVSEYLHARNPNLGVTDEIRIRAWAQIANEAYAATSGNAAQNQAARLREIGILPTRATGTNNWTLTFQNVPPSTAPFTPAQTQAFAAIFDQAALAR